jgi:hypothetical protein
LPSQRCAGACSRRFIDSIAARIDENALREAQMAKDAIKACEVVYAAMGGD